MANMHNRVEVEKRSEATLMPMKKDELVNEELRAYAIECRPETDEPTESLDGV